MGDQVVIDAKRWRMLAPLVAATLYSLSVSIGLHVKSDHPFIWAILPAMVVFVPLKTRYKAPPWTLDYRPPILVLRSHLDERVKHGDERHFGDMDPSLPEANQFVWQLSLDLWDWSRLIFLLEENPKSALRVRGVIVETSDKDKKWLKDVEEIGQGSWVILVFPSSTPGCVDELRLLADNPDLLRKTVVFMPPTADGLNALFTRKEPPFRDHWEQLTQELKEFGFELPEYDPRGMIYLPKQDFSIEKAVSLNHKEGPWTLIADLVPHPEVGTGHLREVINFKYAYEADDERKQNGGRGLWWGS